MLAGSERKGGRDGGAERPQRHTPRSKWTAPFAWFEWGTEWIAYGLSRWALIQVLQSLTALAVLWTAFSYLAGADERAQQRLDEIKQSHYQAWQVISSAEGQGGSGGRVQALEDLNGDKQSLVGLTAADAFQKEIDLAGAELDNANLRGTTLGGADLREASLKNADLRDVVLGVSASDPLERSSRTRPTGHYPNVHRSSQKGCSRKSAGVRRMNRGRFSLPAEVVANTQKGVVGSGHPKRG